MNSTEVKIDGMSCGHCVAAVHEVLSAIDDVSSVDVEIGVARIESSDVIDASVLRTAIEEEGYSILSIDNGTN